jgi:ribosome-associated toxin RatA of RatAB toxin-antitoxin module
MIPGGRHIVFVVGRWLSVVRRSFITNSEVHSMAHTANVVEMRATPEQIFTLAVDTLRWPEFLPHYRWVTLLAPEEGNRRAIEMAAHRDGLPVWWRSVQTWDPSTHRITFYHVEGITRGMDVEWRLEPIGNGVTRVSILHDFELGWPLIGPLANWIVGEMFVKNIANKTLHRIKAILEEHVPAISGQPAKVLDATARTALTADRRPPTADEG